jgi:beta-lactamase superfamily II metal-dependent hydrolase
MSIVKSLSVGDGDMFYIKHDTDNFTIIDCSLSEDDGERIVKELKAQSNDKKIVRFISTHPDYDHIMGLAYLHEQMNLLNFYCVKNAATKPDQTDDFDQYCALRDDAARAFYLFRGCSRKWMNITDEERSAAGIYMLWPITTNEHYKNALTEANEGGSANNISPIIQYMLKDGATVLWMGDLESDFMDDIKDAFTMEPADILFAPHHGRDSGKIPAEWLDKIKPKLVIIGEAPTEHLDYYEGYNTITQNSAGDITLECVSGKTHIYVSNKDYSVDFLRSEWAYNTYGKYIGTLKVG